MPMTVVVTRDVPDRTRGFLSSLMPEPAPGVYASGELSPGVRERMLAVVGGWYQATAQGSIVVLWRDTDAPGGLALATFGTPPRHLADLDGVLVSVW